MYFSVLNKSGVTDIAAVTFLGADPGFSGRVGEDGGGLANPKWERCQPIIWPICPENCMKMKTFGLPVLSKVMIQKHCFEIRGQK